MKKGGRVKFSVGDKKWGGIKKSCEHITVRKEMKSNGDSEILHHDNARISLCFSDFRAVSRTN